MITRIALIAVAVVVVVVDGCTLPLAVPTPTLQAPSFQYIERPRLQSAMWRLADNITALELLLQPGGEISRDAVLQVLDDMQSTASTVSAPGQTTNHPRLDRELPRFLLDLAIAREAVARDPPAYAAAAALPTACARCHSARP
ncbi:MAG: hypothetical protein Q8O67_13030 [Deltaproteobacteria bacterium]|nr:hypothetical protein [Deltaproteobacteria bacterium]